MRFSGKNLSDGLFHSYVFVSSNNEECGIFENNIEVAEKQRQINPKMPPKRKRHVRFCKQSQRKYEKKTENEAPLEQESERESNRLIMARLRPWKLCKNKNQEESPIAYK
ncbi:hypothetical protein TNCV_4896871 [Trichonephila clavipes]|uniref:Uncharacterized protein n=1 Tax=Trichonephila clavipes TaxID=2585209 RepID=A0A8X6VX54_TRICX|nr:hypothetical protein TNCV_4896871 [Trichonephila clavipes]